MFLESLETPSELLTKPQLLSKRAHMLREVREFFFRRNVLEVDTPLLSKRACIDAYIDLMETEVTESEVSYLHSSPEYAMKKLLSLGAPDIYQMSHVFRKGEISNKHQPEFMMIEWYRLGRSLENLLHETIELISLFLGLLPTCFYSYEELFQKHLKLHPLKSSEDEINLKAASLGLRRPTLESSLYFLWDYIEANLEKNTLIVVVDFPASMAALSKTYEKNGQTYAKRFEIYCDGLELANGFDELLDPVEQKNRLLQENLKRRSLGKKQLPLDEAFIEALVRGIPSCSGVAVGFDRLMMLKCKADLIQDVLPISYFFYSMFHFF